jgi:tetratricopeptide (TPR) repeat protein
MAGHQAAAQLQWRTALAVVERRLAQQPDSALLINWKGRLLAESGDRVTAAPLLRLAREMGAGGSNSSDEAADQLALGNLDGAIDQLERSLTAGGQAVTAAAYRLDPDLDPVRSLPRFQALLARMEADPRFSPKAKPPVVRDWPKDPELKKAFDIVAGLDATVESCRLAEDMVNGVLKQRPTDPDATVVYAMLNNYFLNRGYDASEERFVLARRFAERALQLAPEEPEALAAMGQFLTFRGADFARAEELVRRAMTLAPQEPRFVRILSYNVLRVTNLPKALEQAKANVARFPGDALTHYDLALICRVAGELELMEQALDRAIALAPIGSAMIWKGWLAAWMHGDLPGFKSWLDRITGNFRSNERAVYMRYLYASLSGDAAYGLDAVRSYTGTWMSDFYYIGPRSLLLADLLALQGKAELAREEYGRALAEIDRVAQRSPEDTSWERARFWALRGAGRTDEARVAAKRMVERLGRPYRPVIMFWWHDPIPAQLLAGDRADALVLIGEAARTSVIRGQIRLALKIDRRMAPFRDDPEIQALLAEPEVKK